MEVTELGNFTGEVAVICQRSLNNNRGILTGNVSLWTMEPTFHSTIVYSVAIPIASVFGVIGNVLILYVLIEGNFKASVYTYLTVLAAADIVTCSMLLFSGLSRGVFWCKRGWLEFDAFVYLPVVSVSSNLTVWATMFVAVDRLVTVYSLPRCKPPNFCNCRLARRLMIFFGCFATLINVPYCLIYTYNEQGDLVTTKFFHSWLYDLQNWMQLVIFGVTPSILLLVANVVMCQSVRKTLRQRQLFLQSKNVSAENALKDEARMTVMLVGIVFVFLIGEVPTHLASRRSAVSILYGGDPTKIPESCMEKFRMYATLLNAVSSSANFVLYCLLSRRFLSHLKHLLTGRTAHRGGTIRSIVPYAERRAASNNVINEIQCSHDGYL